VVKRIDIEKMAVLGVGQMGLSIAQIAAQIAHYEVYLYDVKKDALKNALIAIKRNLETCVSKEKISASEVNEVIGKLHAVFDLETAVKDADLIIEAVPENLETKKAILSKADRTAKPEAFIVSNTSSISISELASSTKRPEKFAGMHFFNPAQVIKLVEVVRGEKTSDETVEVIVSAAKKMGKDPVVIRKDSSGFVVNRIIILALNEAAFLVWEGVANAEEVDKAIKLGLNWPMGPLALIDYIGVDTVLSICEVLQKNLGPKYSPCPILAKMVKKGTLGCKTGKGFYDWSSQ
jgi:3-hydroxybutyryl-CoA dehydrogenase